MILFTQGRILFTQGRILFTISEINSRINSNNLSSRNIVTERTESANQDACSTIQSIWPSIVERRRQPDICIQLYIA